ncbi:MAG: hypothetical protein LAO56_04920 [Acidobacteriia bacterium]|nr:hypothetical protein [Terriglobia bacterium]
MSEEMTNHGQSGHGTEFEREDLSSRGVFVFMIGLAIVGLVIYFIIVGMYSFLDRYERSQMTTASPLSTSTEVTSRHIDYAPGQGDYVDKKFKDNGAPMLEHDERGQFSDYLMNQEKHLNSYGWVDENAGVAYIPIERAMELTVERGLPVLPQGGATEAANAETKAPATKAPAKQ